jgi:NOL1/NOP2/fmu family ribosome biogenesis protein
VVDVLKRKEMKNVLSLLSNQFGFESWNKGLVLIKKKDKLWVVDKESLQQDITGMRVEVVGIYFGTLESSGLRLSIEGSQIIGPKSKKNIVRIDEKKLNSWLRGFDLDLEISSTYALLRYGNSFAGCGKRKGNQVMNTIPKSRRIHRL